LVQIYKPKKNKPNSTQVKLTVSIDTMDQHGNGIVRQHDPVIIIKGALPAETCRVIITQQKKRVWFGHVEQVIEAHPKRTKPFCPHYEQCGGCQLQHVDSETALRLKQAAINHTLLRALPNNFMWLPPIQRATRAYRRKARLAIDARDANNVRLGFRGKGNIVVSISECQNLVPTLQALILPLQQLVKDLDAKMSLGHITLIECQPKALVSIRTTNAISAPDANRLHNFAQANNCIVESQTGGNAEQTQKGKWAYELCDDINIKFSTNDFIQVNAGVNQAMIKQACEWLALGKSDQVLDLFCGVGNFSLTIAKQVSHVIGIEGVAHMVQQAKQNAVVNNISNATFYHHDLSQKGVLSGQYLGTCNKVLLDPAREGAAAIMPQLKHSNLSHVLYVSCNPDSFCDDAKDLWQQGFKLTKVCVMDMFPNTLHTEIMGLFERA